jgi:hypothetical protein
MDREDRHCWELELRKELDQSSLVKILRDRNVKQICNSGAA